MSLKLNTVEHILRSEPRLHVIYDEGYELSFESKTGQQIAINRKSTANAIRLWVQNSFDPFKISLSSSAEIKHYPASKRWAHF